MSKAATTRHTILQKAFELIYTKGYQTTSVDEIIATTKVTKGAFFYHFKTKDEMGIAIIEEILKPSVYEGFIQPLIIAADPLKGIYDMQEHLLFKNPYLQVEHGCPAGNLTQEMTPWSIDFSRTLSELIMEVQNAVVNCIKRGKKAGLVRKSVKAEQVAYFVMSGYWGIRNFGKLNNSNECYHGYLQQLKLYLNSLK